MINVLYVAPLIPAPSGSGGKKAIFNHVEEIKRSSFLKVSYVFVDVEEEGQGSVQAMALQHCHVFDRGLPRLNQGWLGKTTALIQLFFGRVPRSAAVVTSKIARQFIKTHIVQNNADVIVIDHMNAFGIVDGLEQSVPILYIAHNLESKVLEHQIQEGGLGLVGKKLLGLDLVKLKRFEKNIFEKARKILLIGAADAKFPEVTAVGSKVMVWAELPVVKPHIWKYRKTKRLLFVGSARYFPNRDAVDWLVHDLMPHMLRIDASVVLHIVGTAAMYDGKTDGGRNVIFEGFVSAERLDAIHRNVDMFICPVVLGAGVKIKVLEAASYGIPLAATVESLEGIDFLDDSALQIDRDSARVAPKLISRLNDSNRLLSMSKQSLTGLTQALKKRPRLDEIIQGCSRECH